MVLTESHKKLIYLTLNLTYIFSFFDKKILYIWEDTKGGLYLVKLINNMKNAKNVRSSAGWNNRIKYNQFSI